jgi:hypothetical protein
MMDPITVGLDVVGLGLQLWGGSQQSKIAAQKAQVSQEIGTAESNINAQKTQQMQLQFRRSQLENVRNAQRARAQATASAVSSGAQFGSGLQGGLAGVTDQETENAVGLNQNYDIGMNIAHYNDQISGYKSQLAALGGDEASAAGLASLGGALTKNAGTIGGLAKDAGSLFSFNSGGFLFQS